MTSSSKHLAEPESESERMRAALREIANTRKRYSSAEDLLREILRLRGIAADALRERGVVPRGAA